jgi:hypothetical protein
MGDFNFYRSTANRNRPRGNTNDMMLFNDIIHHLSITKLPIKGRGFTWSNMQDQPLMQQLDWFFTTPNWTMSCANTIVLPLEKSTSDHTPCRIQIGTQIPKASLFRFEMVWRLALLRRKVRERVERLVLALAATRCRGRCYGRTGDEREIRTLGAQGCREDTNPGCLLITQTFCLIGKLQACS